MNDLTIKQCDNCQTLLQGNFCHVCGQEKKNYIRNLSGLVSEFFGEFSNWDSRVWNTLLPLWFRPGYLSKRYVSGHRVPYVPPLRLYLFSSILAFLIFAQLMPQTPANLDAFKESWDAPQSTAVAHNAIKKSQPEMGSVSEVGYTQNASLSFLPESTQQQLEARLRAFTSNPSLAINKFFSLAPQMMLALLPLFALLLKCFYFRSNRFYMEHLIVALYSHCFILHMLVVYSGLGAISKTVSWQWLAVLAKSLADLTVLWMVIYLFLSQKSHYQQGWTKSAIKFVLIGLIYNVGFACAVTALVILSLLSF